ncbi:unnamed protein product [Adineta steineri]|uniref:Uncharacterized protein n=1 Tax=Adineta steineri TaxID=433720 RepID=A0A814TCI4_9BILA|nr:unnamed protein product [Adineta steineri]CAF1356046.1 unnamed protein product [Adineta steineri]
MPFSSTTAATAIITEPVPILLTAVNGSIEGIYSTNIGGPSYLGSPPFSSGIQQGAEAYRACDGDISTKYRNFGSCFQEVLATNCGLNTGFYLELQRGLTLVTGLRVCTADFPSEYDPFVVSLEGSNLSRDNLTHGTSWTLIYNGASGLHTDPGRKSCGPIQFFNNTIQYKSYRFLVSHKRGIADSVQYSEVKLY